MNAAAPRRSTGRMGGVVACAVIAAAAAVFLALFLLNWRNRVFYDDTIADALYFLALPALLCGLTLVALRLPAGWRDAVALSFVSIVPALYGAELWLTIARDARLAEIAAKDGRSYDARDKIDVIRDLRARGIAAYPAVRAKDLLVEGPDGTLISPLTGDPPLLPLAAVPRHTIVSCNEAGEWLSYRSDAHGFRNPPEAWSERPAVALVGDSFTHGDCVGDEANLGALMRERLGSALNLGVAGFGPLSMLASLKEYGPALRPPEVVWFFFEGNDISKDLPVERRSPVLMSYLRDDATQRLALRAGEIEYRLGRYLDAAMAEAMARVDDPDEALLDFLKLYRLRETFGLDPVGLGIVGAIGDEDFALFRAILEEARRTVGAWGGRLHFAYLPDSARYLAIPRHGRIRKHIRRHVLAVVHALGIPVIDIHAVFAAEPDPMALFRYPGSHYNEAGYRRTADAVAAALREPQHPMRSSNR